MIFGIDLKSNITNILLYFVFICFTFGFILNYLKSSEEVEPFKKRR